MIIIFLTYIVNVPVVLSVLNRISIQLQYLDSLINKQIQVYIPVSKEISIRQNSVKKLLFKIGF